MIWLDCSIKLTHAQWLDEKVAGFSDFIILMLYMHRQSMVIVHTGVVMINPGVCRSMHICALFACSLVSWYVYWQLVMLT